MDLLFRFAERSSCLGAWAECSVRVRFDYHVLRPGQEGTWSQRNYPGQGRNLVVYTNHALDRGAPRVKVVDATLYVVITGDAIAIVNEHTFLTSDLRAEVNPYALIWKRTAPG